MPLVHQVLGAPGRDNALFVRVESGQQTTRLLFDCGAGCLSNLSISEIQLIDHLFFSHLHMDHVGGFDSFFRCTFNRETKRNLIWGPRGTSSILHHRFQGFLWNLVGGQNATWNVNDVCSDRVERYRYELSESFARRHEDGVVTTADAILDDDHFTLAPIHLTHHGSCIGYLVREKNKINVQKERLGELGLRAGPWMQELKNDHVGGTITVDGQTFSLDKLRAELLVESKGESLAYLTDFLLDEPTFRRLSLELSDCDTVVCESQYLHQDLELAQRNHHTTINQVAALAAEANFGELILFHLSDRYTNSEWSQMLDECRAIFDRTSFPTKWDIHA